MCLPTSVTTPAGDPANTDYTHTEHRESNLLIKNRNFQRAASLLSKLRVGVKKSAVARPSTTAIPTRQFESAPKSVKSNENLNSFELGFRNGPLPSTP